MLCLCLYVLVHARVCVCACVCVRVWSRAKMKRPAVGDDAKTMSDNCHNVNKRFKEETDEKTILRVWHHHHHQQQQQQRWHDLCAWLDETVKLFDGSLEATRHELSGLIGQCRCVCVVRVVIRDVAVPSPVYDMMLGNIRDAGLTVAGVHSLASSSSGDHRCSVVVIKAANGTRP